MDLKLKLATKVTNSSRELIFSNGEGCLSSISCVLKITATTKTANAAGTHTLSFSHTYI